MSPISSKKITLALKIVVLAGLLVYIGYVMRQQPLHWPTVRQQLRLVRWPLGWAAGLLLLTPVNWGLEALKWQILLRRVEPTRFWDAYRGVLAGVTLGFALPAQLGDTAGRVLSLRSSRRGAAIGASLVSGGVQFYVAILFGTVAWAHQQHVVPDRATSAGQVLLAGLVGLSGLGVVLGLFRRPLLSQLQTWPLLARYASFWNVAGQYSDAELGGALLVGGLRYVVFSVQFYMALQLVGVHLPMAITASGIGLVFLAKTITPAFNLLSDLGVREAASLWVFGPFIRAGLVSAPLLVTATLSLWVANLLLPVLLGLIWVWRLRWSVEKPVNNTP